MKPKLFSIRMKSFCLLAAGAALLLVTMLAPRPAAAGDGIQHMGRCFDYDGREVSCKQSSSSSSSKKGLSSKNQMKLDMFRSVLDAAFAPTKGPTREEIELKKQEEKIKRQQEEFKKQQAIARWKSLQEEDAANIVRENELKQKTGQDLLSKMGSVSGGGLTPFKWEQGKDAGLQFKPLGAGQSTAKLTQEQRLKCAAYFSKNAKNAANNEEARFFNEQAGKAMVGEPTDLECRFEALPELPEPGKPDMLLQKLTILSSFQEKLSNLEDIETKLGGEVKERIKKAEDDKNNAQVKLNEVQNYAATVRPEEKDNADNLVAEALAALTAAETELTAAENSEKNLKDDKKRIEEEIEGMKKQVKSEEK